MGRPIVLDMGRHVVGTLRLAVQYRGRDGFAAARLAARFGEVAAESGPDQPTISGKLGGEWLKPVRFSTDCASPEPIADRRAFRYLRIDLPQQIDQIDSTLAHDNPATAGIGTRLVLSGREEGSGVSMDQGKDMEAAYVTFYEKGSDKPIDTYLLALWFDSNTTRRQLNEAQKITVGDKQYTLYLRPERHYKPYSLHLIDFRHEVYPGTQKPKDFSSHVRIIDKEKNVDRTVRIWMNNPLRYRGETFYQSSFLANDSGTVLQVVKNVGWMIPYVSCMIVAAGMSLHFCMGLYGFLRKRAKAS